MGRNVCKNCHRAKSKKVLAYHQKDCIPTKEDTQHYLMSKVDNSEEAIKRRKQSIK